MPAGSYVRESTFRWLIPDELRLIPFVTTAADMHPAARHEQNQAAQAHCGKRRQRRHGISGAGQPCIRFRRDAASTGRPRRRGTARLGVAAVVLLRGARCGDALGLGRSAILADAGAHAGIGLVPPMHHISRLELMGGAAQQMRPDPLRLVVDQRKHVLELVPEARVTYAHGQMKESELEQIMYDFISGGIDVLVSTTIIETGLDISNVNTIIISDAEKMGLSQLYQLRGRVGRTGRTAYAFLMYKRDKLLREVAEKRLAAIREFTELGSGIRIAMRDLEIRGAGTMLGKVQHGHLEAVGYDLYLKRR